MRGSIVEENPNWRTGGSHSHQGPRKNKVCLLQGEDGDGEESVSVAEADSIRSCSTTISSDNAMGNMM